MHRVAGAARIPPLTREPGLKNPLHELACIVHASSMDPATKLILMKSLALLPFLVFAPLVALTLLSPLRAYAERRRDRDSD